MATGPQLPVHKVIMVGTGAVGKSALTLRFMYDEVSTTTDCLISTGHSFRANKEQLRSSRHYAVVSPFCHCCVCMISQFR